MKLKKKNVSDLEGRRSKATKTRFEPDKRKSGLDRKGPEKKPIPKGARDEEEEIFTPKRKPSKERI